MRKIINYKPLFVIGMAAELDVHLNKFNSIVINMINNGWQPLDSYSLLLDGTQVVIYQAMVKYEEDNK